MKAGKLVGLSSVAFLCLLSAGGLSAQAASGSLVVEQTSEVPGGHLKAGTYTIVMVDSLQDRAVLRVDGDSGNTHLTFLAVPKPAGGDGTSGPHVLQWNTGAAHKHYLRGYDFGSRTVEFVYPKQDAVAIAKANNASVVAIDPKSESRPELNRLSAEDRQMISLWMLTPIKVGDQKGLEAKHYVPENATLAAATSPVRTGTSAPTAPQKTSVAASAVKSAPAGNQVAQLEKPARPKPYRPVMKKLPQTGSNMPLVWMLGTFSLFGAATLSRVRKAND